MKVYPVESLVVLCEINSANTHDLCMLSKYRDLEFILFLGKYKNKNLKLIGTGVYNLW